MLSGQIELGDHQSQPKIYPLWITEKRASNTNTSDDATPSNLVPQLPKRVKTEKKFTGSKIGAIFRKITSRVTTKNLKIGQRVLFELEP